MALAVATTSTAASSNAGSVVVTKPTGVQSGELLVIVAFAEHDGNNGLGNATITCPGFSEGAQAAREGDNVNTDANVQGILLYRIADSTDVAAANYTVSFNVGSEGGGIVSMYRITGWTTGNPVFAKNESNTSLAPTSLSVLRPQSQLLIMGGAIKQDNQTYSFGSYSITSADANPTWTEVQDTSITVNTTADSRSISAFSAYANSSNTSTITAHSATATFTGGSGGTQAAISFLAVLVQPTNATADISHLDSAPTIEGVTASQVLVTADISHNTITPTITGVEGTSSSDTTRWTTPAKSNTSWTNLNKS